MVKMTVRGAPPAIVIRHYLCSDCGARFKVTHGSRDEPIPECPGCSGASSQLPAAPHIANANLNKAVDMAWDMMQKDYGFTDMKDNLKPGDIAAKGPSPMHTAEREAARREMTEYAGEAAGQAIEPALQLQVQDFWKGGMAAPTTGPEQIGAARAASADAVAAGVDALSVLETAKASGKMQPRYNVVAKDEEK